LYGFTAGTRSSLSNALELLEIPIEEELHRADVDAKYTAEIFIRVFHKINTEMEKVN
jgi:DNA polymerase III epsilon subunit-like protein